MKRSFWLAGLALLLISGAALADKQQYMHVRVQEGGGETVAINLPLSLVETLLTGVETKEIKHGRIVIDELEFNRDLIREILTAARQNKGMEFVTIEKDDQEIHIGSKGDDLLVTLDEGGRYGGAAEIRVPLKVVEALLGETEDGRLDIAAALKALGEEKGGRLVSVHDGEDHVEVWVDALAGSDRGGEDERR